MRLWTTALLASLAAPLAAEPPQQGVASVRLIPGWTETDGARMAAIEIRLAPGWYTYWRVPGANGVPPQFDWSSSVNLAAVAYHWPRPQVFDSYGVTTIGYKNALVLPVRLAPASPDAPMDIALDLFFGVCLDICIPSEARITARLEPEAASEGGALIATALAARPLAAAEAGVTAARCTLEPQDSGYVLTAEITLAAPAAEGVTTVIEAADRPDLWIGAAETRTRGRTVEAAARLDAMGDGGLALDRSALRLTLLDPDRAIDILGCTGDG